MKRLFLSLVASIIATMSFAQSSLLATLNHEGTVTTYYGAQAFSTALNAAAHGDVITLSSGNFIATNITKAVTIRGAGMMMDADKGISPTTISGDFTINIPTDTQEKLTMEGIYHNHRISVSGTLQNAMFLKSRFKAFKDGNNCVMKNLSFIHCMVQDELYCPPNSSISCINCFIEDPWNSSTNSAFEFQNCVINSNTDGMTSIFSSSFTNCVLYGKNSAYDYLPSSNVAYNCISLNCNGNAFRNIPNSTNKNNVTDVFVSYTGNVDDSELFELTETAKTNYKGTDGTEVGIHGGSFPFDATPSNPQITKCNVASKSTADGKLSVEIEVKVAE